MKAYEIINRRNTITDLLYQHGEIKVTDLVEKFKVSDETIRKDLAYLAHEGILKKKYGKAILVKEKELAPVLMRTPVNTEKKHKIVEAALTFIQESDLSIGLDQGSTIALLANQLKDVPAKQLFTSSLAAILELISTHHTIHCLGGEYSPSDMSFKNESGREVYSDIVLDVCFFGSSGVSKRNGFCTSSLADADAKRKMLKRTTKKIVLLDSTKFESTSLVQVAKWSEVDIVITNNGLPEDYEQLLRANTQLVVV